MTRENKIKLLNALANGEAGKSELLKIQNKRITGIEVMDVDKNGIIYVKRSISV